MPIYMYTYAYKCYYMYAHLCVYAYMYIHIYIDIYIYIYVDSSREYLAHRSSDGALYDTATTPIHLPFVFDHEVITYALKHHVHGKDSTKFWIAAVGAINMYNPGIHMNVYAYICSYMQISMYTYI
jgi:hypothetical protein